MVHTCLRPRSGALRYDTPLARIWSEWAGVGKEDVTVADVLGRAAPQLEVAAGWMLPAQRLTDLLGRIAQVAAAPIASDAAAAPTTPPAVAAAVPAASPAAPSSFGGGKRECRSSGLVDGWLLAGILQAGQVV